MFWHLRQAVGEFIKEPRRVFCQAKTLSRNLSGDRCIEWSWVAAKITDGTGEALDFGCGKGSLGLMAACKGYNVTALDLQDPEWLYNHPSLNFLKGDLLVMGLPENKFDLIINCSAIEHVGLSGRYGITSGISDGDLLAMDELRRISKKAGKMLLVVPVGKDAVFAPLTRIYGSLRLGRLLEGWTILEEIYWAKNNMGLWSQVQKERAIEETVYAGSWDVSENYYNLGCFVLSATK